MFDALYTKAEKICPRKWMLKDQYNRPVITMLDSEDDAKTLLEKLPTATINEYKTPRGVTRYQIMIGKRLYRRSQQEKQRKQLLKMLQIIRLSMVG